MNLPFEPFSILVVDDEEAMRRSLAEILRLEGYQVETASDGETAISLLQSTDYDLLLLDLKMPGVDGIEVLRNATKLRPDTQVVLLTAHGSLESAIEALRHGANDYLLKPSSTEQILSSVQQALERRAAIKQRQSLLGQLEASVTAFVQSESRPAVNNPESDSDSEQQESPLESPGQTELKGFINYKEEPGAQVGTARTLNLGSGIVFDLFRRELRQESRPNADWMDKRQHRASLTPNEGKLLEALIENKGKVLSHQELVEKIHGFKASPIEAAEILRPLISRLRRKLSVFPEGENWIVSIRSSGYVFNKS